MQEIQGKARTIRELLKGVKYTIDYYQREYKWESKHIRDLIEDLTGKFLEDYRPEHPRRQVAEYGHYFLGSIIISKKENLNFIVDGQQRLTSLTLLLMFLRNQQKGRANQVNVDELIASEQYGEQSFNLDVREREACMQALFDERPLEPSGESESVQNIVARYYDIEEYVPREIIDHALPYFLDWLIENVHLVEITAYSDDDAYTIFETMNDRGLSLSPTDMLKGYLLANITDGIDKLGANVLWKRRVQELNEVGKDTAADSIKTWLRSQYASKIRERKSGARPENFDLIGTEFHRWVRDEVRDPEHKILNLQSGEDFYYFIKRDFEFYTRQYLRLMEASRNLVTGLEHVLYNAHHGFTLQYMLLLAPLQPDDAQNVIDLKMRLVARFVDILLTWRLWNFRSISYNTMQYAMFLVMRDIRKLTPQALAVKLTEVLSTETETFVTNDRLYLHTQNRKYLHRILARITEYIERESGITSHYLEYVSDTGANRFEVEHIWADKPEEHTDEFSHPTDFADYRNRIGGLLLLPKKFNASYGSLPYVDKLPHYYGQNWLARTLSPQCYEHDPGFAQFVSRSGLPFRAHPQFKKADLDARSELYRQIAEYIWDPDALLKEVGL
jgi:uncharacterized protein with ParB-like and HNH nuclease domain